MYRRAIPRRRLILLALLVCLSAPPTADATIHVRTTAQFNAAVDRIGNRAGMIVLERGRYGKLLIGPRSYRARWLTVVARPGALTKSVVLGRSRRVRLVGLRITNYWGGDALLFVSRSSQVKLERLTVAGRPGRLARVRVYRSARVSIRQSDLSRCGERTVCLSLPGSSRVTVSGSAFHDCTGCDFLHVSRVTGLLVRGNTFDRALPSACSRRDAQPADAELAASSAEPVDCNHQDLVQVVGGYNLTIEGNTFGVYADGAAQLYVSGQYGADNIVIRGNHFLAADPAAPGVTPVSGLIVGNPIGFRGLPSRVLIEGNTIESGALRDPSVFRFWQGVANSLIVSDGYLAWPVEARPVVAGNSLATMSAPELVCATAQVAPGQGC